MKTAQRVSGTPWYVFFVISVKRDRELFSATNFSVVRTGSGSSVGVPLSVNLSCLFLSFSVCLAVCLSVCQSLSLSLSLSTRDVASQPTWQSRRRPRRRSGRSSPQPVAFSAPPQPP